MASKIQVRRDTLSNWNANNPVLSAGEIAFVTDENKIKIGDGSSAFTALGYLEADAYLDSVVMGDDTTGNYVETLIASDGISISGEGAESASVTITNTGVLSLAGTTNEVEVSASSGNITLGLPTSITVDLVGNVTGNSDTASTLATARTISLDGDVSGSASFNGGSDITITAAVADDSHNHVVSNIDGLQAALDAKLDSSSYTAEDVLTKIKTVDGTTSGLDADLLDGQDGSYYLDWTNTTNKPDPTITISGDVSGSATMTDLGNVTIATTVADDSHNHIIGNVDGLQSALDLKAPLESPALTGTPTAPTASASANSTQIATTAFVQAAVSNLINGAPGALDTLDELAAALGDDANFATTVTNSLAGKQPLDADLTAIAGLAGTSGFLKKTAANTWSLDTNTYLTGNQTITLSGDVSGSGTTSITVTVADDSHNHIISNVDGLQTALDAKLDSASYTASDILTKIKTVDGATSGLDADLLDGQHGSYYLDWTNVTNKPDPTITLGGDASGSLTLTNLAGGTLTVTVADDSHNHIISNVDGLQTALDAKLNSSSYTAADVLAKLLTVDGSGSGIDADLLDGQSSAYYRNVANMNAGTLAIARGGTNSTATPTAGGAVYGTGTAIAYTSAGNAGEVLTSNGTSAPTWQVVEAGFNPFLLAGV